MLKNSPFYAGFAVDDVVRAKEFYGDTGRPQDYGARQRHGALAPASAS